MNKETLKKILKILVVILIGVGIGYFIFNEKETIQEPEIQIIENTTKIDSLRLVINEKNLLIEKLQDSIKTEIKIVTKLVDSIEKLPIDENTNLLKENLLTYGEFTTEQDSTPILIKIKKDTLTLLNNNNLIDINVCFANFNSLKKINLLQEDIILNDSIKLKNLESIVINKDEIINKQELAYQQNIEELNEIIKKEKRNKIYWEIGGITVSACLLTLLILK